MATAPVSSTPLPTPPSTTDPGNFDTRADAFLGALPTFQTQTNSQATTTYNNAVEAFNSATTATSSKDTAVAAKDTAVASASTASTASSTAVSAKDTAVASASTASTAATTASTARDQAVAARDQALIYATQQMVTSSTTSHSLTADSKTFTVDTGKGFVPNQYLVFTNTSDTTKFMQGTVTSYNSVTGVMVVSIDYVSSTGGPYTTWTIGVIGRRGAAGERNNIVISANTSAVAGNNYFFSAICTLTMPGTPGTGEVISFSNCTQAPGPVINFGSVKVKGKTVGAVTMDGINDAATVTYTGNSTLGWGDI